jgi:hypothetical protein
MCTFLGILYFSDLRCVAGSFVCRKDFSLKLSDVSAKPIRKRWAGGKSRKYKHWAAGKHRKKRFLLEQLPGEVYEWAVSRDFQSAFLACLVQRLYQF